MIRADIRPDVDPIDHSTRDADPVPEALVDRTPVRHPVFRHGIRFLALSVSAAAIFAAGCVENHRQIKPDADRFAWPVTVVADPSGDFVYVISSNFDSECTGGTIIPVSVDTLDKIQVGAVEIGSFNGEAVITRLADGRNRLWVPSRDSDALQFADISRPSGYPVLFCDGDSEPDDADGEDVAAGAPVPVDAAAEPWPEDAVSTDDVVAPELPGFHACSGRYSIGLKDFKVTLDDGTTEFADNPYGIAAGGWTVLADGRRVQPIYVAGIVGGAIDVFLADDTGNVEHKAVALLDEGCHTVAEYMVTDSERVVWISNRSMNEIIIAHVRIHASGEVDLVVDDLAAADILGSTGSYFRGMARSLDGRFLYAAYRSPAGLAVFEIEAGGGLRYRHLIALDGDPSGVAVYRGLDGAETVYVTETAHDGVYAVDPLSHTVIDTIFVGAAPYGIAIAGGRAFVANFEDSTVSVFGVEPGSDDYHVETVIE